MEGYHRMELVRCRGWTEVPVKFFCKQYWGDTIAISSFLKTFRGKALKLKLLPVIITRLIL
jgi:hypothetical protein